jgi:hypothetical protein
VVACRYRETVGVPLDVKSGEFAAAVELRRRFLGIADNESARRACDRGVGAVACHALKANPDMSYQIVDAVMARVWFPGSRGEK